MLNRYLFLFFFIITSMVVGCNKSNEYIGAWKSTVPSSVTGKTDIWIFEPNTANYNGQKFSANYEQKSTNTTVYLDRGTLNLNMIDKNTMMLETPNGAKSKYIRSTTKEAEEIISANNKPMEKKPPTDWRAF